MGFVRGLGIGNCARYITGDLWKGAGELLRLLSSITQRNQIHQSDLTVAFTPPNLYLN